MKDRMGEIWSNGGILYIYIYEGVSISFRTESITK
jgi:hypothetical protein